MTRGRHSLVVRFALMGLALIALIVGAVVFQANNQYQRDLEAKMEDVKQSASEGHKIVIYYYGLEKSGKLSREQAQAEAKNVIAALRSGGDDYIWINTYEGVMISHPNTDLIGKNLSDTRDSGGDFLFRRFTEIAQKDGAGYIRYYWPRPASTEPVEKISWVYGFSTWNWIVGTGMFLDAIHDKYIDDLWGIAEFTALLSILFLLTMTLFAKTIIRSVSQVSTALQSLAEGEFYIDDDHAPPDGNEFGKIWAAIKIVRERLISIERITIENKVSYINHQVEHDKKSRNVVAEFENTFVDTWDKVRGTLIGIRYSSASLNDRIGETHQHVGTISQAIEASSEAISGIISSNGLFRLEFDSRIAECSHLIDNYNNTTNALSSSLELAHQLSSSVYDLQQSLSVINNAASHIRLIELVLNDIVMADDKSVVRHDYLTLSAETKAILYRMSASAEALTARLEQHQSNAQNLAHLRDTAPQPGAVDTATMLTNIKETNDHIAALSQDMALAIGTATTLANHARDIALSIAKENADLVKISWQLGDAVSHMENLVVMVEEFMGTIRNSLRMPI